MFEVDFDLRVHIVGTVYVDDEPARVDDLLDAIFPDGWEGEILGISGDMDVTPDDE